MQGRFSDGPAFYLIQVTMIQSYEDSLWIVVLGNEGNQYHLTGRD
jgi:hypothetical protein